MKPDELLGRAPAFRALSADDRARIAAAAVEQSFAPGDVVLRANDPGAPMLLVAEGTLSATEAGRTFGAGDVVGELAALADQPNRHGEVVAETAARCYAIDPKDLYAIARTTPSLAIDLLQALAQHVAARPAAAPDEPAGPPMDEQMAAYVRDFRQLFQQERDRANELQTALMGIVRALVGLCEAKDPTLAGHGSRVGRYAQIVAKLLGWPSDRLGDAGLGGLLHDVGNIAIDSGVLLKRGMLSGEEWATVRSHPEIGASIVREIGPLQNLVPYILAHHERWDGRGFPGRLVGQRIPIEGRLISVVDTFDTLISRMPNRDARSVGLAVAEIRGQAGTAFDPAVVEAFYRAIRLGEIAVATGGGG